MASRASGEYPPVPEALPAALVDTHTHLDIGTGARLPIGANDLPPEAQPEEGEEFPSVDFFHETAQQAGVTRAVQIGCELPSARWTAALVEAEAAAGRPWLLGGAALHPNEAPRLARAGLLEAALDEIEGLVAGERMRVVGETGLDYFRTDESGRDAQVASFRAHIEIAKRTGLALQIHDRDAHRDVLDVLADAGAPERTVFHCFSGDEEMARECAAAGYYLSFAGKVTFKNAGALRAAAAVVPRELLLTETDAPFLTPHPYRGRPGGPYLAAVTARALADVRGQDLAQLCEDVTRNAERIFGAW